MSCQARIQDFVLGGAQKHGLEGALGDEVTSQWVIIYSGQSHFRGGGRRMRPRLVTESLYWNGTQFVLYALLGMKTVTQNRQYLERYKTPLATLATQMSC